MSPGYLSHHHSFVLLHNLNHWGLELAHLCGGVYIWVCMWTCKGTCLVGHKGVHLKHTILTTVYLNWQWSVCNQLDVFTLCYPLTMCHPHSELQLDVEGRKHALKSLHPAYVQCSRQQNLSLESNSHNYYNIYYNNSHNSLHLHLYTLESNLSEHITTRGCSDDWNVWITEVLQIIMQVMQTVCTCELQYLCWVANVLLSQNEHMKHFISAISTAKANFQLAKIAKNSGCKFAKCVWLTDVFGYLKLG